MTTHKHITFYPLRGIPFLPQNVHRLGPLSLLKRNVTEKVNPPTRGMISARVDGFTLSRMLAYSLFFIPFGGHRCHRSIPFPVTVCYPLKRNGFSRMLAYSYILIPFSGQRCHLRNHSLQSL